MLEGIQAEQRVDDGGGCGVQAGVGGLSKKNGQKIFELKKGSEQILMGTSCTRQERVQFAKKEKQ